MLYQHLGAANKDLEFIDKFDIDKIWVAPKLPGDKPIFPTGFNPPVVTGKGADHMRDEDCIIGVTVNRKSRAYPDKRYWIAEELLGQSDRIGLFVASNLS